MKWNNVRLIFWREVSDQLRDRRTLFMVVVLPLLLYPGLGIGMMQMMLLFSEQPRTVVVLGAENLGEPALLDGDQFSPKWFPNPATANKLKVLSGPAIAPIGDDSPADPRLETARKIAALLAEAEVAGKSDRESSKSRVTGTTKRELNQLFSESGIQVLLVIPDHFREMLAAKKARLINRHPSATSDDEPDPMPPNNGPRFIQNSADEKSMIAAQRVQSVLSAWQDAIADEQLLAAGLPDDVTRPVQTISIDLAEDTQLSATLWSKLFPALLIVMAVTGAFYPAIDLGAGEKERGTMETLLICPATRTEIVLGKFFTVMLFSMATAILNLGSLGFTSKYMVSMATQGPMSRMGDLSPPPFSSLFWVLVLLVPLASLFSALCLALATFARSSKEGQYYLTPLLMVTMGLTVFCMSPAVELQPFYTVLPVVGPALLLKGLLLGSAHSTELYAYALPVLLASFCYSGLALWWAIDQFGSEEVLFREAERFELGLWMKHLFRDKEPTPSFTQGVACFVMIMLLQFASLSVSKALLGSVAPENLGTLMLQLLFIQQLVIIATPALLMGIMLTSSVWRTFQFRLPAPQFWVWGVVLPLALHPLSLELGAALQWFFPPLPEEMLAPLKLLSTKELPLWLVLLAFAAAPAICEEFAFRGFILSGFRRTGRVGLAVVFSSLAFGAMHLIPQQVFNASLLGLVLGLLAVRSGSIWPGVVFHFVYNGTEVMRSRYGKELGLENHMGLLFRVGDASEGGLRYEMPLLILCGAIAGGVLFWILSQHNRNAAPGEEPS